jgi:hypothetical protein
MIGTQKDWLTNLLCWGIGINYSSEQLAHQKADEADVGAGSLAAPVGFV